MVAIGALDAIAAFCRDTPRAVDDLTPSPSPLRVTTVLRDAVRVYRLLFQRSVTTAAVVYGAVALIGIGHHATSGPGAQTLALVAFLLNLSGPLIVQGALVEIVRNVHDGRAPESIPELFRRGGERFWPLLGASFLYAFGVLAGLILLIVPAFIVAARWSLLVPLVMLERNTVGDARRRSAALVKGRTGRVLGCVFVTYLLTIPPFLILAFSSTSFATTTFLTFLWSTLTAPFEAHVLTVIYYRLADPQRPVIDPRVLGWRSVWEGR
jgi:hypothetical protein